MPMRRVFGAHLAEARFETVRHLKTPAFALPFLIIPVALYLFFSIVALNASNTPPDPALRVDLRMFTGFGIVGVMGPALFAFGMAEVAWADSQHKEGRTAGMAGAARARNLRHRHQHGG
jgi:ABC-2 type transport system permease protein